MRAKDELRRQVWRSMDREGVSRFPGARGRIPNFAGAKVAAERLVTHAAWLSAATIKANPDSPQTHARRLALAQGKTLVMAVPRLRDEHPFRLLDPRKLDDAARRDAATIKGALRHGDVVDLDQVPELDLILTGSVGVSVDGARLGKGGGFSDLEYGLLRESGKIDDRTMVATTVHRIQILRESVPMAIHDVPVDVIATPSGLIGAGRELERPPGILWDQLQPRQLREIPVLDRFGYVG